MLLFFFAIVLEADGDTRAQLDDLKREHSALAKGPEPIDWDHYSKTITAPGVVDAFRKAYESTQYPKFDVSQVMSEIQAAEKKAVRIMLPSTGIVDA